MLGKEAPRVLVHTHVPNRIQSDQMVIELAKRGLALDCIGGDGEGNCASW